MKSQRIVATAQRKIAVEDFELPSLEPDQVLIEKQFSAISPGTELAFLHHLPDLPPMFVPLVMLVRQARGQGRQASGGSEQSSQCVKCAAPS